MQKSGVVMDVTNPEQAIIAEESGAVAVMALERVPADIRAHGDVARMADPLIIENIIPKSSITGSVFIIRLVNILINTKDDE